MVEIAFYHLERSTLESALPRLLEKTLEAGKKAVVLAGSEDKVETLNDVLWSYEQGSWLPHGSINDGHPENQPIWLSTSSDASNGATFLFLTDGGDTDRIEGFERCFILFDGNDPIAVDKARERWLLYKEKNLPVVYWQEQGNGGWKKNDQTSLE